jgi:hypothetical protein
MRRNFWDRLREIVFDYLIFLAILITAVVAIVGPGLFGLNRDQVIIALLAFLAVEAFVDRQRLLNQIRERVDRAIDLILSDQNLLKYRRDFPSLGILIARARKAIWIGGIALDSMAQQVELFSERLREDKEFRVRFILVAPDDNVIGETAAFLEEDADWLTSRVKGNLAALERELAQAYPGQVQIRTVAHRPALGFLIVDPEEPSGYMTVVSYPYGSDRNTRPILELAKESHPEWFNLYLEAYRRLWGSEQTGAPSQA